MFNKYLLIPILLFLIGGCALFPRTLTWDMRGHTKPEFFKAESECRYEFAKLQYSKPLGVDNFGTERRLFKSCMRSKGFKLIEDKILLFN